MFLECADREGGEDHVMPGLAWFADPFLQFLRDAIDQRFIRLLLRKRIEQFGVGELRSSGHVLAEDRFAFLDASEVVFDPVEDFRGEIGALLADEVARDAGRSQMSCHRTHVMGAGQCVEPFFQVGEVQRTAGFHRAVSR